MACIKLEHSKPMNEQSKEPSTEEKELTKWANAPTVTKLKQDFTEAKLVHDVQELKIDGWLENLNVTGKALVKTADGKSKMVPKLIRKQAEWRYAALSEPFLSTDDVFKVKPVSPEDRDSAKQNELLLNHQFNNRIDKVRFIDEYVRTAVDEGTVIVRAGWDFHEEEYTDDFPIVEFRVNPEIAAVHEQLAAMKQETPSLYRSQVPEEVRQAHDMTVEGGQPIEPVVLGYEKQTRKRTLKNAPTATICDYRHVVIDPTCLGDMSKCKFVVYHYTSSLAELKKDGKYKNLDAINIEANSVLANPDHDANNQLSNFKFSDKPRQQFVVYEYWGNWDINGDGTTKPIVAAWVGNTLIRMEENPYPDKAIPFIVAHYLPVRKSTHGEPDGALLEDNQMITGAVTRGMIDVMGRSANGQMGVRKDALDATNRRKFDKGQDYEFNANVDPRQGIYMHTFPEIPQSAQYMLNLQNMEAESLTGVQSFSQGISGRGMGNVADGVRGALNAASKRELGILRRLGGGIVELGRKFISMNAEFLDEEEVVRVTDEEFVEVRRDDLGGKFDLKLGISTAEEDDNKAEQLAFLLQTLGNTSDPELTKMILADIARLRKMPDMARKIENFKPEPDPNAQKMAELQMAMLEAQVDTERAKAEGLRATAQLSGSKAGTEQVKQGNLQSNTDQQNLDFVEQESGVKQERELQKHGEQARSQAQLKLMDREFDKEDNRRGDLKDYLANR